MPDEILCVEVRQEDGTLAFESLADYREGPRRNTYVVRDCRKRPDNALEAASNA